MRGGWGVGIKPCDVRRGCNIEVVARLGAVI